MRMCVRVSLTDFPAMRHAEHKGEVSAASAVLIFFRACFATLSLVPHFLTLAPKQNSKYKKNCINSKTILEIR